MAKRLLSDQQKQRIEALQNTHLAEALSGLVIAHFGTSVEVENENGKVFYCKPRQNLSLVVGDQVAWQIEDAAQTTGVVLAVEPRRSSLWRKNKAGESKVIAANVDQIIIVVASEPQRSEQILDRSLVLAALQKVPAIIVFNKADLLTPAELSDKQDFYKIYTALNKPVLFVSTLEKKGMDLLAATLADKISVITGLSGVGKSSLTQHLLPEQTIRIGQLSENRSRLGQHTTSTARLYHLTHGGMIIDSPGVREFAMQGINQAELERGFEEFAPFLGQCKFRNCQHLEAKGCAIAAAVEEGKISGQRLEAYQRILSGL